MPRRRVLRYLKTRVPDPELTRKYLLHYTANELYCNPHQFPPICAGAIFAEGKPGEAEATSETGDLEAGKRANCPLELEIGCGTGEYLCALAQKDPTTNFVGIDKSLKMLYLGVELAGRMGLDNIKFIEADVHLLYPLLVPDALRAVYLHFPEPYGRPKIRRMRRIFTPHFLDHMARTLQPAGLLSVVSDDEVFFLEMLAIVEQDSRFAKIHVSRYLEGLETEVKSRFQRIWEGHEVVPRRFIVKKL